MFWIFCLFILFYFIFKSKLFNLIEENNFVNKNISFFFEKYEVINKNIILNNQFKIIFLLFLFLISLIIFKIIFLLITSYFSKKNRDYRAKIINVYNKNSIVNKNRNVNGLGQEKLMFTILLNLINIVKTKILSFIYLNLINIKKRTCLVDKFLKNSFDETLNIKKRRRNYYNLLLVHFLIFKLSRKELVHSLNLTKKLGNYPFSLSYDEEVISFRRSKYFDYSSTELFFLLFYGLLEWFLTFYILHLGFCIFYDFNVVELSFQFFENFLPLHYKLYKDYIRISLIINLIFFFFFSFYTLHSWIMELTDEVSTYQLPSKDWFVDVFLPALQGIIIIIIFFSIFFLFFYNGWYFLVLLFNCSFQYFYNFTFGLFISLENLILFSVTFDFNIFTQLFLLQKPGIISEFYVPFFSTNSLLYTTVNNQNKFLNDSSFYTNTFFSLSYQNSLELKIIKSELLMDIRKYNKFICEDSQILYTKYLLNKGVRGLGIRLDNQYLFQEFDSIFNFYPRHFRPNSEQLIDPLISSNFNFKKKNNTINFISKTINLDERKFYSNFFNNNLDSILFNNSKKIINKKYFNLVFEKLNQNILVFSNFFFHINFFNKINNNFEKLYSLDFLDINNFKLRSKYLYNDIKGSNFKFFEKRSKNKKLCFLDTKKDFFYLISFIDNNIFSKLDLIDQKELISLNKKILNIKENNNKNLIFKNSDHFFNYLKKTIYIGLNKEFLKNKILLIEQDLNLNSDISKKNYLKKELKLKILKNSFAELKKISLSMDFSDELFNNLKIISNDQKNMISLILLNVDFFLQKEKTSNLKYKNIIDALYNFLEKVKKFNKFELNIFNFSINSDFKYPFLNNFFKPFYYLRHLDYPQHFLRLFTNTSFHQRVNPINLITEEMFLNNYFLKKLRLLKIFANFPSLISFNTRKNILYLNSFDEKIKLQSSKIILKNDIINDIFKYDFSSYYDLETKIQNFCFFQNTMSERYLHKYFSSTLITEELQVQLNQFHNNNLTKLIFAPSKKRQNSRFFQNLNFINWKIIKDLWLEFPNQDYVSYYNQYFSNISTSQNYLKLEFNYSNILFDHENFQIMKGFEKRRILKKKKFIMNPSFLIDKHLLRSYQFSDYFSSIILKDYQTTLFYDKQNFLLNNYLYFILKNKINFLLKKHHNFTIKFFFRNFNLIDNKFLFSNTEGIFLKDLKFKKKFFFSNDSKFLILKQHNHLCFKNGLYCKHNNNFLTSFSKNNFHFKYYKNFKNLHHFIFSNKILSLDLLFNKDYFYGSKYLKYRYKNIDNFKLLDKFKEILKFQIRRFNEFSLLPPRRLMFGWNSIQDDSHLKFLYFSMYWPFNKFLKNLHTHLHTSLWSDNMTSQPYWLKFLILFSEFLLPNPLYVFVDFLKPLHHQTFTYDFFFLRIDLIDTDTIYGKSKFEFDQYFFRNYPSTNLNLISYNGIHNYLLSKNLHFNSLIFDIISDFNFKTLKFKHGFFYSIIHSPFPFREEGFYEKIDRDFYLNIVNTNKNYKSLPQGLPFPIILEDSKNSALKFSKYIENCFNDNLKFVDYLKYVDLFSHVGSFEKKIIIPRENLKFGHWVFINNYDKYTFIDFLFLGNHFHNFKIFTDSKISFYDPFGFVDKNKESSFNEDTLSSYNKFTNRVSNIIYYDSHYFHNMDFENFKNKIFQEKIYDSTIKNYLNKKLMSFDFFKILIPYINIEEILQFKNTTNFLNLVTKNEELSGIFKRINIRLMNFIDRIVLKDNIKENENNVLNLSLFKNYFWFLNLRNYVKLRGVDPWNLFLINKNNNVYDSLYYINKILFTTNKKEQNERLSLWITPYRLNFYGIKNYNFLNKDISNRDFKKIISFYTQKKNLMGFLEKDLSNLLKENYKIKLKKNNLNNNEKKSLFYKNKKILFNNPNSCHYFIKSEFFKTYFFKYKINPYNFNMFNFPFNNQFSNISTKILHNILIQNQLIGKIKSDRIFGKEFINNQYRFKRLYFLKFFEIYEKNYFDPNFSPDFFYKNFNNYFKLIDNKNSTFLPLINSNNFLDVQSIKKIDNEIYTFVKYFNKSEIFLSEFDFLDKIFINYSFLLDSFYIDFGLPLSEWFVNDEWISKRFRKYGFQFFKTYRTFYKKDERFNLDFISRRHIRKLQSFFIFEKQKQKKKKLLKYYYYRKPHKLFIYKFIPNFFKRRSKQNSSVYKWIFVINKIKPTPTILIFKNNEIRVTKLKNYLLFLKVLGNSLENFSGFLFWNYLLNGANRVSFLIGKPDLNFTNFNDSFVYKNQSKLIFINKQLNNKYLYFYNSNKTFFSFYRINNLYNKNYSIFFDFKKYSLLNNFRKFNKFFFELEKNILNNYQMKKLNQFKYLSRFLILKENQRSHLNFYTPQEYLYFFNNKWFQWLKLNKFRKIEDHYIQYNISSNKVFNFKNYHNLLSKENNDFNTSLYTYKKPSKFSSQFFLPHSFKVPKKYYIPYNHQLWYYSNLELTYPLNVKFLKFYSIYNVSYDLIRYQTLKVLKQKINFDLFQIQKLYLINDILYKLNFDDNLLIPLSSNNYYFKTFSIKFFLYYLKIYLNFCYFNILKLIYLPLDIKINNSFNVFDIFLLYFDKFPILGFFIKFLVKFTLLVFNFFLNIFKNIFFLFFFNFIDLFLLDCKKFYNLLIKSYFNPFWILFFYFFWILYYFFLSIFSIYDRETYNVKNVMAQLDWDYEEFEFNRSRRKFDTKSFDQFMRPTHLRFLKNMKEFEERDKTPTIDVIEKLNNISFKNDFFNKNFIGKIFDKGHWFIKKFPEYENSKNNLFEENLSRQDSSFIQNYLSRPISLSMVANYLKQNYLHKANYMFNKNIEQRLTLKNYPDLMLKDTFRHSDDATEFGRYKWFYNATFFYFQFLFVVFLSSFFFFLIL